MSSQAAPEPSGTANETTVVDDPTIAIDRALSAIARRITSSRVHDRVVLRAGLTAPIDRAGFIALARIHDHGPLRLSDLAPLLGVDLSTVSRQVRTIEDQGMVVRHPDPTDKRAAVVEVSVEGRIALERLRSSASSRLQDIIADWTDDERAELARSLTHFNEAVERYGDRP